MGYTHSFRQKTAPTPGQWRLITLGFKKLQAAALLTEAFPIQRECDDPRPPEITSKHTIFNGIGDNGYETMMLEHEYADSWFCKTNHKPYDRAVVALLILADHCAPGCWEITSDGNAKDWQPTLDWMNSTSLGKFRLPSGVTNKATV